MPGGSSNAVASGERPKGTREPTSLDLPALGPHPRPSPVWERGSNARMQVQLLPDQNRLHLNDGPIDLIINAEGDEPAIRAAYHAAINRFGTVLDELCAELPLLRRAVEPEFSPKGTIARRMWHAVLPFAADGFITPMAAVAGSVAQEILGAMTAAADLRAASVNNGGDIALHLAESRFTTIGLIDRPDRPSLYSKAVIHSSDPVRGVATSGWRGRSFSLGIADAVTVLAETAARADAAATVIANAVDLPGHPGIIRVPARDIQPDNDLGNRPVTRAVPALTTDEIDTALASGLALADRLLSQGCIAGAALHLQGTTRLVAAPHKS
jgi:uncharacterized protein